VWPTPKAEAKDGRRGSDPRHGRVLDEEAALWPTPNVPNGGRTLSPEAVAAKGATAKGKRQVGLENVASLWPTPASADGERASLTYPGNHNPTLLGAAVGLWPTAGANDWKGTAKPGRRRGQLDEAAEQLWATPSASVANDGEGPKTWHARAAKLKEKHGNGNGAGIPLTIQTQDFRSSLPDLPTEPDGQPSLPNGPTSRLQLNAAFVEWMFGLPAGWTGLKPLAIPFCICKLRQHLQCLLRG